jgi:hypothetical protein
MTNVDTLVNHNVRVNDITSPGMRKNKALYTSSMGKLTIATNRKYPIKYPLSYLVDVHRRCHQNNPQSVKMFFRCVYFSEFNYIYCLHIAVIIAVLSEE